jgi:ABC-2 type transport system permease protein
VLAAVHAEWTKQRTVAGPGLLLLAAVVGTVALSAAASGAVSCPGPGCPGDPAKTSLTGVLLGQAVIAVVAVLTVGTEYSTGMISSTLMAVPRRGLVLFAKAVVLVVPVLVAGCVAVFVSLVAGWLLQPGARWLPQPVLGGAGVAGHPALTVGDEATLRAGAGSVLYLALIALFSLGVATIVRSSAAAIGIVLGVLFVFPILAAVVTDPDWQRHLKQIAPSSAGLAVQATTGLDSLPISPWAGLGVLGLWAAGALVVGGVVLRLRDA